MSKLQLGQVVITRNAMETLDLSSVTLSLRKHSAGKWGDVCVDDWKANDEALVNGDRILSSYKDINGTKFWIITEADRSSTTVLLPEDY